MGAVLAWQKVDTEIVADDKQSLVRFRTPRTAWKGGDLE